MNDKESAIIRKRALLALENLSCATQIRFDGADNYDVAIANIEIQMRALIAELAKEPTP